MKTWGRAFLLLAPLAVGCAEERRSLVDGLIPGECNPLGGSACALPLPSSVYLREDSTTATGFRVDFAVGSLPTNTDRVTLDPGYINRRDGFSANASIVVSFPEGVDDANLPPENDPAASLLPTSPTVLVDMETGQRIPHFAELDGWAGASQPDKQALIIRSVIRLEPKRRYAVALLTSLNGKDGAPITVPPGFRAILDGEKTGHPRLERVRGRYPAIFAALDRLGIERKQLLLAWDFVTASDESLTEDMLKARDAALVAMGEKGRNLGFKVTEEAVPTDEGSNPVTAKILTGTFDAPLFMTFDEKALPADRGKNAVVPSDLNGSLATQGSLLARGAQGEPTITGTLKAPFMAVIPRCALERKPVPILIYGHGIFGLHDEVAGDDIRKIAQHLCVVALATDLLGMSDGDVNTAIRALANHNRMAEFFEKIVQGIVNTIALAQVARGPMAESVEFSEGGKPILDPAREYFYGNSQGGIYGGTFMACDPFITRGVLGVGGVSFSLLLERSTHWASFLPVISAAYPSPLDNQVTVHLIQMAWDAVDPVTTARGLTGLLARPVPGSPPKQVLMQVALGDSEVSNLGAELQARIMGIPMLGPPLRNYAPYGLEWKDGELANGMAVYDQDPTPRPPLGTGPREKNETHWRLRRLKSASEQIRHFFETGKIVQTCMKSGKATACECGAFPHEPGYSPEPCGKDL
ncbi:MAG: hypothetical protein HY698_20420 [Deltaproteobacteria bacterium]|nr:hypothetical protein [Deltaproteobacteria bacterium]